MADDEASLDDFFAKKDRSKKKQKNKFKYGDIGLGNVISIDEDNSQTSIQSKDKTTTQKKEREKAQTSVVRSNTPVEGEEEWIDFEEKTEKDYSGLRIQNIQISNRVESENETDQRDGGDEENGEDGREKEDTNQGPWNKTTTVTAEPLPEPAVIPKPQTDQPKKYVPPGMRSNRNTTYKKKKGAPDLKNEEEFPTLGTGPPADWATQSKSFEAVRSGGRRVETSQDSLHLTLENQFAALS